MKTTAIQDAVVAKLLAKGWIDPFPYAGSVTLHQADRAVRKRTGYSFIDYHRKPIRVTKTGRVLCG